MAKNQRSYSREFKIEAVRVLESTGKSQTKIERELGIGSRNLSRWNNSVVSGARKHFRVEVAARRRRKRSST